MSQLTIEGLDVRVAEGSDWDDSPWGDVAPAFSGRMRSDVLTRHRTYRFRTTELETADKVALELMLRSPGPLLCSGDLIGTEAPFHVLGPPRIVPVTATDFVLSFVLRETDTITSDLLLSFDGDAPGAYTFTRTGTAYRVNGSGVLEQVADGIARLGAYAHILDLDGDGVFETPAYLGEPAAQNQAYHTQDLDFSGANQWSQNDCTITADATTAPDGTATADKIVEDAGAAVPYLGNSFSIAASNGQTITKSWYLKAAERTEARLDVNGRDSTVRSVWFDLTTGTIGTAANGAVGRIRALANGWYRCTIQATVGTGGTSPSVRCNMGFGSETIGGTGDGSSGLYAWQVDILIDAPAEQSPIPATTALVTRNADTLYLPWLHAPSVFASEGVTFYAKFREGLAPPFALQAGVGPRIFHIGSAANGNPRLFCTRISATDDYQFGWHNGTTSVTSTVSSGLAPALGDLIELCCQFNADGSVRLHASKNGGAVVSAGASGALSLTGVTEWSAERYYVNSVGATGIGIAHHVSHKAVRGIYTMDQMRNIASARAWARVA